MVGKSGLSDAGTEKQKAKELKMAQQAEDALVVATTIRMYKPPDGWGWRPDIKRAYENRQAVAQFLQADVAEPPVELREGRSAGNKEYIEYTNVSKTRKDVLCAAHDIKFAPKSGGPQAIIGSISKAWAVAEKKKEVSNLHHELDAYGSVEDVEAAAVAEDARLEQIHAAAKVQLGASIVEVSREIGLAASDVDRVTTLLIQATKLQGELAAQKKVEEDARAAALKTFADLRTRVAMRAIATATPALPRARRKQPTPIKSVQDALQVATLT